MEFNAEKVRAELERIGKDGAWLARQVGTTRQAISRHLKQGANKLTTIKKIADALGLDGKDLIKE